MKPIITIYIALLFTASALAQGDLLATRVTFQYENTRLRDALADISNRYEVNFSYSPDYVNVRQKVTINLVNVKLATALDKLFEKTQIVYVVVGSHIVLKIDPDKPLSSTDSKQSRKKKERTLEPETEAPVLLASETITPEEMPVRPPVDSIIRLDLPENQPVRTDGKFYPMDETLLNFEKWRMQGNVMTRPFGDKKIAQISILPFVGTNARNSDDVTNNISMNLLWGVNGGVDGFEIGTFFNSNRADVKGFQAAGLGNKTGRNVTGTQVGGLFNIAGGRTRGFQAAGLFNMSGSSEAAQAAGLMNIVKGDVAGMQASGLFNRAGGNAQALQAGGVFNSSGGVSKVQAAGVFNLSRGKTNVQVSGLFNSSGGVETMQISPVNVSRGQMKGLQIGLINISDTVSGVPIALINIVKHGYNKFEIYGGEALHANLELKLGAKAFYNTFYVGARVPPGDGSYTWAMGYGIGTVSMVSPKSHLNFELMAIHVSENEPWTNSLNSIGQFRFLWNYQLGQSIGFFIGPTANVMISQLQNAETGEYGSFIVPYSLVSKMINDHTSLKSWVGVNAGFRF